MSHEEVLHKLRIVLADLYLAGARMPRHTPAPGGCATEHQYPLTAGQVWMFDKAMEQAAEALGITDLPHNCCVGSRLYDESVALEVIHSSSSILGRKP